MPPVSETRLPVVDAHQHLWDPATGWYGWLAREPEVLQRAFTFDEARDALDALDVVGTVLVQAADRDEDTDAMLAEATANPRVLGVVGYVPLEQPERAADRLAELRTETAFVGVRNLIHDQPDPDWLRRPDVAEGLAPAGGRRGAVRPGGGAAAAPGARRLPVRALPRALDRDRPPGQAPDRQRPTAAVVRPDGRRRGQPPGVGQAVRSLPGGRRSAGHR